VQQHASNHSHIRLKHSLLAHSIFTSHFFRLIFSHPSTRTRCSSCKVPKKCDHFLRYRIAYPQYVSPILLDTYLPRILTSDDTLRATASRQPPPFKRRKLTSSGAAAVETPQNQSVTTALTVAEDTRVHVSKVLAAAGGRLVCISCHRAISVRPECIILCARYVSPIRMHAFSFWNIYC
jgi:hypothetical protein